MSSDEQRHELAQFIRSRRERHRPEDVGLPSVGHRRTPGLRLEEVATIADVSITWYTWLEQAREIRVSRQVLGSLAGALGLDAAERNHLFRLAGEMPPGDTASRDRAELPRQYELLLAHLDPNPAFIVNPRFDILAWNRGCELLYGDLAALPEPRSPTAWLPCPTDAVPPAAHQPDTRCTGGTGTRNALLGSRTCRRSPAAGTGQPSSSSQTTLDQHPSTNRLGAAPLPAVPAIPRNGPALGDRWLLRTQAPTVPSTPSRRKSACPLWRPYSRSTCTITIRSDTSSPHLG